MPRHSKEKIEAIKNLREKGFSIIQIMQKLSLSKTTVWNNVQGIELSTEKKKILRSNQGGSKLRKQKNIELAEKKAEELFKGIESSYITVISMLYWAEGHKKERVLLLILIL